MTDTDGLEFGAEQLSLLTVLKTRIPRVQMRLFMQDAFTKTGLYTLVEVLIRCKQISVSVKTRLSMLEVKSTVKSKIVAHFFVVFSQSERYCVYKYMMINDGLNQ